MLFKLVLAAGFIGLVAGLVIGQIDAAWQAGYDTCDLDWRFNEDTESTSVPAVQRIPVARPSP